MLRTIFWIAISLVPVMLVRAYGAAELEAESTSVIKKSSITETVLNDIRNAFEAVSNNSNTFKKIIPEMFHISQYDDIDPIFMFQISTNNDSTTRMLKIKRSDFNEPIFPNVSSYDMSLHLQKIHTENSAKSQSEWNKIGLEGWMGHIYNPFYQEVKSHGYVDEDAPNDNLFSSDVSVKQININPTSVIRRAENKMNSSDVYIARANNPFGFSTKWQMRASNEVLYGNDDKRFKRDAIRLYSMIKCSTGCEPLIYKGYGCYCGFLGNGKEVDGIDRCCKLHDKCYERSNCISFLEYFVPYIWKCYRGKPLCAIDHGQWGGPDSCAARLCDCDLRLSRCLRQFQCPKARPVCSSSRSRRLQNLIYFLK